MMMQEKATEYYVSGVGIAELNLIGVHDWMSVFRTDSASLTTCLKNLTMHACTYKLKISAPVLISPCEHLCSKEHHYICTRLYI